MISFIRHKLPYGVAAAGAVFLLTPATASVINLQAYAYNSAGYGYPGQDAKLLLNSSLAVESLSSNYTMGTANASASAYADLTTGKVGALSTGLGDARGVASAYYMEYVNFNIAGASSSTLTRIGFRVNYHGLLATAPYPGILVNGVPVYGVATSFLDFNFSSSLGYAQINATHSTANQDTYQSYFSGNGFKSVAETGDGSDRSFYFTYDLLGATPTASITLGVGASTIGPATSDFSNTAGFEFDLPNNVTWTSQSGVYLQNAGGAVPEPSSWALMVAGFGFVGGMARRRQLRLSLS